MVHSPAIMPPSRELYHLELLPFLVSTQGYELQGGTTQIGCLRERFEGTEVVSSILLVARRRAQAAAVYLTNVLPPKCSLSVSLHVMVLSMACDHDLKANVSRVGQAALHQQGVVKQAVSQAGQSM